MLGLVSVRRFMSERELARFIVAIQTRRHVHRARDLALFVLLATVGLRPSEALAMTPEDFSLSGPRPWIRVVRMKKRLKARQFDEMEIPSELARVLHDHVQTCTPGRVVFKIHQRTAQRLFHSYTKRAGLRQCLPLYSLRHTAATRIFHSTKNIHVVQAVLGHERPDVSCIYAHVTRRMVREGLAATPPII
jgi:integrase